MYLSLDNHYQCGSLIHIATLVQVKTTHKQLFVILHYYIFFMQVYIPQVKIVSGMWKFIGNVKIARWVYTSLHSKSKCIGHEKYHETANLVSKRS